MTNLLPQIPSFNGSEQWDGETVQDWLEHFESVALLAGWKDYFKLVHLVSTLRGTARSFYRSCTPAQRGNYHLLVAELKKRFTPVQLTAVQTQLFHNRKQGQKETVDDFAQDLRKLHSRAYSTAMYANSEAEKVGQMVLANQFISGLRPELQAKIVGMEGTMDALVLRARFEEAKAKELAAVRTHPARKPTTAEPTSNKPPSEPSTYVPPVPATTPTTTTSNRDETRRVGSRKCYNCGLEGHMARACPYEKSNTGEEAQGRPGVTRRVTTEKRSVNEKDGKTPEKSRILELRRELHRAELEEALEEVSGVLGVLQSDTTSSTTGLGPTAFASVSVNGVATKALVDTGSPATIISLKFILKVLAGQKTPNQTAAVEGGGLQKVSDTRYLFTELWGTST